MSDATRTKPRHPGEVLVTHFLKPQGIGIEDAAARMGLPAVDLDALISGARDVTPQTAVLLAELTRTTAEFWLRLQEAVDIYVTQQPGVHTSVARCD